jgi:2-dehydropantoate 2-reductase
MVGATLDEPGVVTHTFVGATYLGPLGSSCSGAVDAVVATLGPEAGVEVRPDIADVLWSKAVLATGAMGLSVLLRVPYHHVFVEPGARRVFYDVIADAATLAEAEGATLVDLPGPLQAGSLLTGSRSDALDRLAAVGARMVATGQTTTRVSMLQSLESGRRLEVQAVFTDLLDVADRHGLAVPLLRAVAELVGVLDDVNARPGGER